MTRLCHLASNPCTPTELNNVLRVPWWAICPVVHATTRTTDEKTHESFSSYSPLPFRRDIFFRPFCSNRLIASTRIHEDVSLSKSGEGNADDEWHSEEEMKVACRPGIYIFPRVTRLMIRLYAVARTRASRHFFQSGRRCWETRGQRGAFSISSYFRPIFGKIRSARGDEESDMIIGRWIFIRWNCRTEGIEIDTWIRTSYS